MRWDEFRRSDDVAVGRRQSHDYESDSDDNADEYDERGDRHGRNLGTNFCLNFATSLSLVGLGGIAVGATIVLALIGYARGIDPPTVTNSRPAASAAPPLQRTAQSITFHNAPPKDRIGTPKDQMDDFVAAVLGNTEDTWRVIFRESGEIYRPPQLRLFSGTEQSGCGFARAASGPFYCPGDRRIYLDTSFFDDIRVRFHGCTGRACEFAEAYVIAHEVGHHVQNLLGILPKAQQMQRIAGSQATANRVQVRLELQADCLAGVWAHRSNLRWRSIEPGDVEAALQTAAAIGDDRLQKQARGFVVPDAFTHGTSAQRRHWFAIGLKEGRLSACDTFAAGAL